MSITISKINGTISIVSPYHPAFITKIKNAGGKWNKSTKTWDIDERNLSLAREIMREVYGRDDQMSELVTVRVTLTNDVESLCNPVTIFGKIVASAWGRDSGARLGEGVCFEKGSPKSGGSMKNWRTIIPKNSVIVIHDVPKNAVENHIDFCDDWGIVELIEVDFNADQKQALLEEKEKLLKRLGEIENLLL